MNQGQRNNSGVPTNSNGINTNGSGNSNQSTLNNFSRYINGNTDVERMKNHNNGPARVAFRPTPYTEEEHQRIRVHLDKVLGPEYVSHRPGGGGGQVSYIEGWRALNLANEIFGFNGWNSELISQQIDFLDTHGNTGKFSLGLSVVVRVTIKDGTYHEDFGYGFVENSRNKAQAFEKCKKEAFTDGVKRCLRCFGNVLGNCLYDKTILPKIKKVNLPKPDYEDIDFYRDPQLVERERRKQMSTTVNIMEKPNGQVAVPSNVPARNADPIISATSRNPTPLAASNILQPTNNNRNTIIQSGKQNSNKMVVAKPVNTYKPEIRDSEDMDDSFLFSDDFMDEDSMPRRYDEYTNGEKSIQSGPVVKEVIQPQKEVPVENDHSVITSNGDSNVNSDSREVTSSALPDSPVNSPTPATNPPIGFPLFVSAKGANMLQANIDDPSKLPHFDTKFVAPSMRRTVDPNKSAPVKRTDASPTVRSSQTGIANINRPITRSNTLSLSQSTSDNANSLGKRIGMPPSQRPAAKRLHRELSQRSESPATPAAAPVTPAKDPSPNTEE
ncbi:DNA repair and recombination protein RAD52 [Scheffersomyces xylosifermentans]|uniref:DNA repair and recombination protein RAD52 n=1 Tax=Scheffersomyces xylosifermentans TaxID=1304137 RepID=UPI00315D5C1A